MDDQTLEVQPEEGAKEKKTYTPQKPKVQKTWTIVYKTRDANGYILIAEDKNDLATYRLSKDGKIPDGIPQNWSEALAQHFRNPDDITRDLWRIGIRQAVYVDHEIRQQIRSLVSRFLASHGKTIRVDLLENYVIQVIS